VAHVQGGGLGACDLAYRPVKEGGLCYAAWQSCHTKQVHLRSVSRCVSGDRGDGHVVEGVSACMCNMVSTCAAL
jgi:hypothetical protein